MQLAVTATGSQRVHTAYSGIAMHSLTQVLLAAITFGAFRLVREIYPASGRLSSGSQRAKRRRSFGRCMASTTAVQRHRSSAAVAGRGVKALALASPDKTCWFRIVAFRPFNPSPALHRSFPRPHDAPAAHRSLLPPFRSLPEERELGWRASGAGREGRVGADIGGARCHRRPQARRASFRSSSSVRSKVSTP